MRLIGEAHESVSSKKGFGGRVLRVDDDRDRCDLLRSVEGTGEGVHEEVFADPGTVSPRVNGEPTEERCSPPYSSEEGKSN